MIYPYHLPYPWVRRRRRRVRELSPKTAKARRKLRWKYLFASAFAGLLGVACIVVLAATLTLIRLRPTLPSVSQIASFTPSTGTRIYSADGMLLAKLTMENRRVVPLKEISEHLLDATLAVEDSRFYDHGAVDPRGLGRAAWSNLVSGNSVGQGGSTITMQLARNVDDFGLSKEKRLSRKLREIMTAIRIEQVYSKDEILELYLNQIYYGNGAYGAEAASRTYFAKPASRLTLAEAALIAGLPQRPEGYSPYRHLARAVERRNVVLSRMLATGRISRSEYDRAIAEPVRVQRPKRTRQILRAPYFVDWVLRDLVRKYGVDALYGGMKIVTTLDWRMQQAAEKAVKNGLRFGATQGALVCIDPHTGEVRAMVGGTNYEKDRFNAVTQGRRQPGSAFKPIVYAAAFDSGAAHLWDEVTDEPISTKSSHNEMWTVKNYSGNYSHDSMTVHDAIVNSVNTVSVKVGASTGIPRVIGYAKAMGINTPLAPYLTLSLGASAVRPIEICQAYSHFATGGPRFEPTGVKSLHDTQGRELPVLSAFKRMRECPIHPSTIVQINQALRAAVTSGTGYAVSGVPNAFGKTGTTSDYRDAWFVGYTPELVTTVWVGSPYRDRKGVLHYRRMPGGTGGKAAAPIWARFMKTAVPIQKRYNQIRRVGPYAIYVPEPPELPKEPKQNAPAYESVPNREALGWFAEAEQHRRRNRDVEEDIDNRMRDGVLVYRPTTEARKEWEQAERNGEYEEAERALSSSRDGLVRICADSGKLARNWCSTTYLADSETGDIPHSYCPTHRAPPGE